MKVLFGGYLAGGVFFEHQRRVVRRDARAVVGDADLADAAVRQADADGAGARVDRVLHQLLDDAQRPLDDLARGDLIRYALR
jgi:hypothetical protein